MIDDRARVRGRLLPSAPVRLPLFFFWIDACDDGDSHPRTTATATIAAVSRANHEGPYGKRSATTRHACRRARVTRYGVTRCTAKKEFWRGVRSRLDDEENVDPV